MFSKHFYQVYLQEQSARISNRMDDLIHRAGVPAQLKPALIDATRGGKRFRALLVFLTFSGCGGEETEKILDLGCAMEFLHKASLAHDDVSNRNRRFSFAVPIADVRSCLT